MLVNNNEEKRSYSKIPIFKYIMQNDLDKFSKEITKDHTEINYCYKSSGDTPLILAARYQRYAILQKLISQGAELEHSNVDKKRAVHEAASSGCMLCLQLLIDCGAQVDALKRGDWTPLMLACIQGHLNSVKALVIAGADIFRVNKDGWTCFHLACREGFVDILDYLFNINSAVIENISNNGRTPLHTCSMHGKYESVRFLLNKSCEPVVRDSCGTTPLMDAIRFGFVDIAGLLLESDVSTLEMTDNLGRHCLHIAAHSGQINSVKYLIERCKVDINIKTEFAEQGIVHLASKEGHIDLLKLILSCGIDINELDKNNRTALHLAVAGNKIKTVCFLLKLNNCDTSLKDKNGKLAQEYALSDQMKQFFF